MKSEGLNGPTLSLFYPFTLSKMIAVLFVCLGNICRSPVAEGVFRRQIEEAGLSAQIRCDSAGTAAYHIGQLPDRRSRDNAHQHGLSLIHRARRVAGADFSEFTYFVAMDEVNFQTLQNLSWKSTGLSSDDHIFLLREFDPDAGDNPDVPDPYYEDALVFEEVYQIIERSCRRLLLWLSEVHKLPIK
jgi:protein-tyrosine phosphatase